jgi:hypothetical protein
LGKEGKDLSQDIHDDDGDEDDSDDDENKIDHQEALLLGFGDLCAVTHTPDYISLLDYIYIYI